MRSQDETHYKIEEAEYFLKKIQELEQHGDDNEFEHNLDAFLYSWASIFEVMLEDYQRFYGLKISMLDNLSIGTFKEHAKGNKIATDFIEAYDDAIREFFGHPDHKKILELLDSPMRVDEFIVFLLRRIDWNFPTFGYHDCYIALYNVIQDILGWNLDYHRLIMQFAVMSRQKLGFDVKFVQSLLQGNFKDLAMNLDEVFEQSFLRQQVLKKQESRLAYDQDQWKKIQKTINELDVQTPIFTIAGLLKKKRHTKTHRKGSELMSTVEHYEGDKLIEKTRNLNFLRENYVSEEQGMIFGHFNTPLETIETCKQMLKKTREFVKRFNEDFPMHG